MTVITPVYIDAEDAKPAFFVGSRGPHADIGGITPGSMPPFSRTIDDEGVRLNNVKLVAQGRLLEDEILALLRSGAHPSRNPAQNLADLKAQIAANEKGAQELRKTTAASWAPSAWPAASPGRWARTWCCVPTAVSRAWTTSAAPRCRPVMPSRSARLAVAATDRLDQTTTNEETPRCQVQVQVRHPSTPRPVRPAAPSLWRVMPAWLPSTGT